MIVAIIPFAALGRYYLLSNNLFGIFSGRIKFQYSCSCRIDNDKSSALCELKSSLTQGAVFACHRALFVACHQSLPDTGVCKRIEYE